MVKRLGIDYDSTKHFIHDYKLSIITVQKASGPLGPILSHYHNYLFSQSAAFTSLFKVCTKSKTIACVSTKAFHFKVYDLWCGNKRHILQPYNVRSVMWRH